MDLASLEPISDGAVIPLRHPVTDLPLTTDKGEPITVTVVGMDSDQFKARQRVIINRRIKAGKKATATAEGIEEEALDALASCVTALSNIVLDGKPVDHSTANVKLLFSRLPWLKEQVDEAVADRANFLKASATN